MKLIGATESVLLIAIAEAVQNATYDRYKAIIFPKNFDDKLIKQVDENFRSFINKMFDGSKFSYFIEDQLNRIRIFSNSDKIPKECNLTDFDCFKNNLGVAKLIVDEIKNLPLQYILICPICDELSRRAKRTGLEIQLSDRSSIVSGDIIKSKITLSHQNKEMDSVNRWPEDINPIINDTDLFFHYNTSGYMGSGRIPNLVSDFYEEIRALYGILLNDGVIFPFSFTSVKSKSFLLANTIRENYREFSHCSTTDEDIATLYSFGTSADTDILIDDGSNIEDFFVNCQKVFRYEESLRLKTAAAWITRSETSNRNLDKAIQSAIALEVLLGDRDMSDRVGLSKLMANRCAYTLGKNEKDRKNIIDQFLKFYKLRSEIVHSGRSNLTSEERRTVNIGKNLAEKTLRGEISRI